MVLYDVLHLPTKFGQMSLTIPEILVVFLFSIVAITLSCGVYGIILKCL